MRPLIGITVGPRIRADGYSYLELRATYAHAVEQVGGLPVLVPPMPQGALQALLARLDGLIFPGGLDVDPAAYGEAPHPKTEVNAELDRHELATARLALESEMPILGICRGQQLLNVALGGSLVQHIEEHQRHAEPRGTLAHGLRIEPRSRLAELLETTDTQVNSLHHQAVRDLGRGLRAVAWAADGTIEGLESNAHPWLVTVQFHPEDLVDSHAPSNRLIAGFVSACQMSRSTQSEPV
jgi:putative glutamine amidotransferase